MAGSKGLNNKQVCTRPRWKTIKKEAAAFLPERLQSQSQESAVMDGPVLTDGAVTGVHRGHHSLLLINSPNELAAKDIGRYRSRAIMERRLAASINILARTSTMYYWKGEIQDASEVLMTSRIQQVMDFVRSVHPYANPEVLSFLVEDGSLAYMKWMDEAIPDD
ncbi:hypothetical protein F7725_015822 [Dissostichus mawsoni]|uniref:Uncharacterized protein n=1 Tax=Dissostichus mawsoni TaxID=36200 RepID=A0A7J5YIP8_DISMA|nr:hypothetical protein F7725_015822 [Dissostichus mawsoni]